MIGDYRCSENLIVFRNLRRIFKYIFFFLNNKILLSLNILQFQTGSFLDSGFLYDQMLKYAYCVVT